MTTASGLPTLPAGYEARRATADDAHLLHALLVSHFDVEPGGEATTFVEFEGDLLAPTMNLATDSWVVEHEEVGAVAFALAFLDRPGNSLVDTYLSPAIDGPLLSSVAEPLVRAGIARVTQEADRLKLAKAVAVFGMVRGDRRLTTVARAIGMQHARSWFQMQANERTIQQASPVVVPGFSLHTIDPHDDAALREFHAAQQESFAEHYGHVPRDFDAFAADGRALGGLDPTMWWVVRDDASYAVAAVLMGSDIVEELGLGYVDTLGVLTPYRRRGLAGWLLRAAMKEYARRGRIGVRLGVDATNETGAVALYERVGMQAIEVIETWELRVGDQRFNEATVSPSEAPGSVASGTCGSNRAL